MLRNFKESSERHNQTWSALVRDQNKIAKGTWPEIVYIANAKLEEARYQKLKKQKTMTTVKY